VFGEVRVVVQLGDLKRAQGENAVLDLVVGLSPQRCKVVTRMLSTPATACAAATSRLR